MPVREEVLNVRLADILKSKGLRARAEVIVRRDGGERKLPDVIIDIQGVRIIIEARSQKAKLTEDAISRVQSGICSVAIGLLYPASLAGRSDIEGQMRISRFEMDVVYFDRTGLQKSHRKNVSIDELVEAIHAARQIQVREDLTAYHVSTVRAAIDAVVKDGLDELDITSSKNLAAALSQRLGLTGQPSKKGLSDELLRIAVFVLFDAMIFQGLVAERYPNRVRNVNAVTRQGRRNFLVANWDEILGIDYQPIFRIARDILDVIPNNDFWNAHLQELARVAAAVQGSGVLAKHDFMGRLFHRLLLRTTGEAFATYYTAIPTAYLLSRVAVNLGDDRLADVAAVEAVRVGDFACGSGTLLSAAYTAYRDRYVREATSELHLRQLHKALVEDCIWGLDVLDYAAHLTLTTLALHHGSAIFDKSNIWRVPVGRPKRNGPLFLGSLELYYYSLKGMAFIGQEERKGLAGATTENISLPSFDLLLMNPPFSRTSKPKVAFSYDPPNKSELQKRLRELSKHEGFQHLAIAGMGGYFVPLAIRWLKVGGRIGFVLNRSMLAGAAWDDVRRVVRKNCYIEMIISNFDPGHTPLGSDGKRAKRTRGWAFSEETDIGEVLIIARKTSDWRAAKASKARFLNIFAFPANEYEAISLADEVLEKHRKHADGDLRFDGKVVATTYLVDQSRLSEQNWQFACTWASRDLNAVVMALMGEQHLTPLRRLASSTGCDISPEKAMFEKSDVRTAYKILWTHGVSQNTLELDASQLAYGSPKRPKKDADDFYERHRGFLLIGERPHLKTTPTFAIYSPEAILSTPLWEICLKDERHYETLTLWLNSTYGILLLTATATNSQGEIFKLKKDQLLPMNVIDPANIDIKAARALWRSIERKPLSNVGSSWAQAAKRQGIRYEIDAFFAPYMKTKLTRATYELLATEPAVTYERRSLGK